MRCSRCGHDNPYENFFCGNCGSPLLHRGAASQTLTARATETASPQASSEVPISGPSFLGLAEAEDTSSLEYLYDEEPQHHYGRMVLAILVLAAFGAFIVYQWKQSPKWRAALSRPLKQDAGQAQTQDRAAADLPEKAAVPASSAPLAPQDSTVQGSSQEPAPAADEEAEMHATADLRPLPQSDTAAPARSQEHAQQPPPPPARDDTDILLARGVAHLYGRGAPRSCNDALVFLNRAADKGNTRAASQLGGLYATGHCVPLDRAKAYQYFTRASQDGGNVYLNRTRQMLWNQMSEAERTLVRGTR